MLTPFTKEAFKRARQVICGNFKCKQVKSGKITTPKTTNQNMFTPFRADLKFRARSLRKDSTRAENKLWYEYLRYSKIRFLRQKPIGNYIVDFYCAAKKLVIELDGESHFITDLAIAKDQEREKFLRKTHNLTILRFSNNDVFESFEGVCYEIEEALFEKEGG